MGFLSFLWTNFWGKTIVTFILSMSPILELRGSIAYGMGAGLDERFVFIIAIIGNMLPVPFIILFIRKVFEWMRHHMKWLGGLVERLEAKGNDPKNQEKIKKYGFWGLFMFVAIPLPGTGAWTASLVAAMLGMRLKNAVPAICLGVVCAGVVVTFAYSGILGAVGEFLK